MVSIFISYAHSDGTELAQLLHMDLRKEGNNVWLDTVSLKPGSAWSLEIEKGLLESMVVLVLLSKASVASKTCNDEIEFALNKGKILIPILLQPDVDIPFRLNRLQWIDFSDSSKYEEGLTRLKGVLSEYNKNEADVPRLSHRVISLPDGYVNRAKLVDEARILLLNHSYDNGNRLMVLEGIGGIGKSTLARALCNDPLVQSAFPNGIIWVEIGKYPHSNLEIVKTVGVGLGDLVDHYTSDTMGQSRLEMLLREKVALIVLDNVWKEEHVDPFRVFGSRCQLLITTRKLEISISPTVISYSVKKMSPDEAEKLVRMWAKKNDLEIGVIADRVGYLPLALKLAGIQLGRNITVDEWIQRYTKIKDLRVGKKSKTSDSNLKICFDLSVDDLEADERELYYSLGIFVDDGAIPISEVKRLWQFRRALDDSESNFLIDQLRDWGLIESESDGSNIRMHNLLHEYCSECIEPEAQKWHNDLLNAYQIISRPWPELASDNSYLRNHLIHHLQGAARYEEIVELFQDTSWRDVRIEADQFSYVGYIQDLETEWMHRHLQTLEVLKLAKESDQIALCVRYALIRTSINSLASNYSPHIIANAVENPFIPEWTPERALRIITLMPDLFQRLRCYSELLKIEVFRKGDLCKMAQKSAWETWQHLTNHDKAQSIEQVVYFLSAQELDIVLEICRNISIEEEKFELLSGVIKYLPLDLIETAFELTVGMVNPNRRTRVLSNFSKINIDWNEESAKMGRLIDIAQKLPSPKNRVTVWTSFIRRVDDPLKSVFVLNARKDAVLLKKNKGQSRILYMWMDSIRKTRIARLKKNMRQSRIFQEIDTLEKLPKKVISGSRKPPEGIKLSIDEVKSAVINAQSINDWNERIQAITSLASYLSESAFEEVFMDMLYSVDSLNSEILVLKVLGNLAPQMSENLQEKAIRQALTLINDEYLLLQFIEALFPPISDFISEMLFTTICNIRTLDVQASALSQAASWLSEDQWKQSLDIVYQFIKTEDDIMREEGTRYLLNVLQSFIPSLPATFLDKTLSMVMEIADDEPRKAAVILQITQKQTSSLNQQDLTEQSNLTFALSPEHESVSNQITPSPFELKQSLIGNLWGLRTTERKKTLMLLVNSGTLNPQVLPLDTLTNIAYHLRDVCSWTWV